MKADSRDGRPPKAEAKPTRQTVKAGQPARGGAMVPPTFEQSDFSHPIDRGGSKPTSPPYVVKHLNEFNY